LIDAYGGIIERTILTGVKTPVIDYINYRCIMPYDFYNIFLHKIKLPGVTVLSTDFTNEVQVVLQTTEFAEKELLIILNELRNNQGFSYLITTTL